MVGRMSQVTTRKFRGETKRHRQKPPSAGAGIVGGSEMVACGCLQNRM